MTESSGSAVVRARDTGFRTVAALAVVLAIGPLAPPTSSTALAQEPSELVTRGAHAGADAALLRSVLSRAEDAGLDGEATASLLRPAVDAAEAGLPSELLLRKSLEGLSKRVPPERVGAVLADLRDALGRAASVVDPALARPPVRDVLATPDGDADTRAVLIESGALGLSRGASDEALRSLLDRLPAGAGERGPVDPAGLRVAMEVLADLSVADRSPRLAADLVLEALGSGFGPAELRELPGALEAAGRRGQLPAEAAARGAMSWMRSDVPASAVLQNLFSGEFPGKAPFDVPPGLDDARDRADRPGPP